MHPCSSTCVRVGVCARVSLYLCVWQPTELILILALLRSIALSWVIHFLSPLIVFVSLCNKQPQAEKMHSFMQSYRVRPTVMNEWVTAAEEGVDLSEHTNIFSTGNSRCIRLPYLPAGTDYKGCGCAERGWWLSATDALTLIQTGVPNLPKPKYSSISIKCMIGFLYTGAAVRKWKGEHLIFTYTNIIVQYIL